MKMANDLNTSDFAEMPGWYHVAVTHIDPQPVSKEGSLMDCVQVEFGILEGTEKTQLKRTAKVFLSNPSESHKDGGQFALKVQCRFLRAVDLLPKVAPGEEFDPNWLAAQARQLVVKMKKKDQGNGIQIDGAHLYHVDDDEVKDVPKSAEALKLIKGRKAPAGNGQKQAAATTPQAQPQAAAASVDDDFSDL